jgi:CysZ protein
MRDADEQPVRRAASTVADTARSVVETAKQSVVAPVGRSAIGFWRGLTYSFRGARLVYAERPGLVRYWGMPVLLTLLAAVGIVWGAVSARDALVESVWSTPTGEDAWDGALRALHAVVEWLVALLLAFGGLVALSLVTAPMAAPFNDALSEAVEEHVTGRPGAPFSLRILLRDTVRTVFLELAKFALYAVVMGPLFVLSFVVPVLGQAVYVVFGFVFTAVYFSIDYIDWPASRRDRGLRARVAVLRRNFWPMFGFGTGVWFFLIVPFVNLLFMPAAVAGGTLLFLDLEGASPLPDTAP